MEFYQLRQFEAAARHKNMTRAAEELCIAQPALSKTIHKLEEEFNAQLFIRNKKGLLCTKQGEILLRYANQILPLVNAASKEINESLGKKSEIRLCVRSSAVLISNVLSDFIHEHPSVHFSISSESEGCDLLIDSISSDSPLPQGAKLLMSEEICLAVSGSHPLAGESSVWLKQLEEEKFIDLRGSASYAAVFQSVLNRVRFSPKIAYSCEDYVLQSKLISLGLGVSFVASVTWMNSYLPENVVLLRIKDADCFRNLYYMPLGIYHSETQKLLEQHLKSYFQKLTAN